MEELKVGDTVELKSGGPKMTISQMGEPRQGWFCIWFDGKERKEGTFTAETLRKA